MALTWRAKTIGPSLPSFYLDDDRLPFNKTYGFNLFSSNVSCLAWLDKQLPCSVVLVSYGTVSEYDEAQLELRRAWQWVVQFWKTLPLGCEGK